MRTAKIIAFIMSIVLLACSLFTMSAYADVVSADEVFKNAVGAETYTPEQTTEPVNIALVSEDQKMKGSTYRVYKLVSASYDGTIGAVKNETVLYAPGIDASVILPDQADSSIQNVYSAIDDTIGTSDFKWNRLDTITSNVERLGIAPAAVIVSDGESVSLPGTGVYLVVMDKHDSVEFNDDYLTSPFFTIAIKGLEDLQTLQVPIKRQTPNLSNLAGDITGQHKTNPVGALTAIYQPENVPEDSQVAIEQKQAEEQKAAQEENGENTPAGNGILSMVAPIVLVVGGIFVLNLIVGRRKKTPQKATGSPTSPDNARNDHESIETTETGVKTPQNASESENEKIKPLSAAPADDFVSVDVDNETMLAIYGDEPDGQ